MDPATSSNRTGSNISTHIPAQPPVPENTGCGSAVGSQQHLRQKKAVQQAPTCKTSAHDTTHATQHALLNEPHMHALPQLRKQAPAQDMPICLTQEPAGCKSYPTHGHSLNALQVTELSSVIPPLSLCKTWRTRAQRWGLPHIAQPHAH